MEDNIENNSELKALLEKAPLASPPEWFAARALSLARQGEKRRRFSPFILLRQASMTLALLAIILGGVFWQQEKKSMESENLALEYVALSEQEEEENLWFVSYP